MKKLWLLGSVLLLSPLAGQAFADPLPTPVIKFADPEVVYPGHTKTDAGGLIPVSFYGTNLGPLDGDNGHPAGWSGGYQHTFIRGISGTGVAGPWVECKPSVCLPYGSTGVQGNSISLGIDPGHLKDPGGQFQTKEWVSLSADTASDPAQATTPHSDWSAVYTINIAKTGAVPPVPAIAAASPKEIDIDGTPAPNWYVRLFGTDLCTYSSTVFLLGKTYATVPVPVEACSAAGSGYPAGTQLFDVQVPPELRNEGPLNFKITNDDGASNFMVVTIRQLYHVAKVKIPLKTPVQSAPLKPKGPLTIPHKP